VQLCSLFALHKPVSDEGFQIGTFSQTFEEYDIISKYFDWRWLLFEKYVLFVRQFKDEVDPHLQYGAAARAATTRMNAGLTFDRELF
jgi:hypothetical protein